MKSNTKLLLVVLMIIISWLMAGFGFTTKLGHPISEICFYLGLVGMFIGIIFFIITVKEK